VTVTLSGSLNAVTKWKADLEKLRKQVCVAIDVDRVVGKTSPQPGVPTSAFVDVEVFGIPEDLRLETVTPAQIDVSVTKRDS
jgi:hypothetical protein